MRLDKLFKIAPVKVRARDKSRRIFIVEHRIGKEAGAYTKEKLMARTGLEDEYYDVCSALEKKFRDRRMFEQITDQVYQGQKKKLTDWVRMYRKYLERFYEDQGLRPCVTFVPITEDARGLYLQSLIDMETEKLVVGEPTDHAIYIEATFAWTKPAAMLHKRSIRMAKELIKLPGVNSDVRHRMQIVSKGQFKGMPQLPEYMEDDDD